MKNEFIKDFFIKHAIDFKNAKVNLPRYISISYFENGGWEEEIAEYEFNDEAISYVSSESYIEKEIDFICFYDQFRNEADVNFYLPNDDGIFSNVETALIEYINKNKKEADNIYLQAKNEIIEIF